jgi:hypothetical protein
MSRATEAEVTVEPVFVLVMLKKHVYKVLDQEPKLRAVEGIGAEPV